MIRTRPCSLSGLAKTSSTGNVLFTPGFLWTIIIYVELNINNVMWSSELCEVYPFRVVFWGLYQYFTTHNSVSLARLFIHCRTSGLCHGALFLISGATVLSSIQRFISVTEPLQKLAQRDSSQFLERAGILEYLSQRHDNLLSPLCISDKSKVVIAQNYGQSFRRSTKEKRRKWWGNQIEGPSNFT